MGLEYSKEALNKLGIYELRNLAREVGVYSPTTLVKSELVNKIIAVISGEDTPYVRKTNQGRPPKKLSGMDDIYKMFRPTSVESPERQASNMFTSDCLKEAFTCIPADKVEVQGYVKIQPDTCAVLMKKGYFTDNLQENYFIADITVKKYNLKDGDFLYGLAYQTKEENPLIVTDIHSINGVDPQQLKVRNDFKKLESLYPFKKITLNTRKSAIDNYRAFEHVVPFGFGSRVLCSFDETVDMESFELSIVNKLSKLPNFKTVMLALEESPEFEYELSTTLLDVDLISNKNKTLNEVFEEIYVKLEHLQRLVEQGNNICLVVSNVQMMFDCIRNYLKSHKGVEDVDALAGERLLNIFNLAKATHSGSFTVVAFSNKQLIPSLEHTINAKIVFNSNFYPNTQININPFTSRVKRLEKLLSAQQVILREKFLDGLSDDNFRDKFISCFEKNNS